MCRPCARRASSRLLPSCGRRASEARERKARGGAAAKNTGSSSGRRFMRLRRGSRRENDDALNALGDAVPRRRMARGATSKRLSQVLKKFDGHRTITASRKTCVIWNCVHHARKHLRGRRPPRDSGGVDADLKVSSRLSIAGLDDTKFSGELHWYTPARTYPSDSEARPDGSDKRCREGSRAHLKSRSSTQKDP